MSEIRPITIYNGKRRLLKGDENIPDVLLRSHFSAKGDIIVGSSSGITPLPVGTSNKILTTDDSQPSGWKWSSYSSIPTGLVIPYGGLYPPDGFLSCDGAEYTPGMYEALANVIGITYGGTITDLCSGGTAISGGYKDQSPANAFDDNTATYWKSSQEGAAVKDTAYIGYAFTTPVNIKHFRFKNYSNSSYNVQTVKLQSSADGASWGNILTATVNTYSSVWNYILTSTTVSVKYWRIMAASELTSGKSWNVNEIEMSTNLDTFNVPNCTGRVIIGDGLSTSGTRYYQGSTGGEDSVLLTSSTISSHQHTGTTYGIVGGYWNPTSAPQSTTLVRVANGTDYLSMSTNNIYGRTGSDLPHNNIQPMTAVNLIIKT